MRLRRPFLAAYIWRQLLAGAICATAYPIARGIEGMALIAIGFTLSDPLHTIWLFVIVGSMMAGLLIMARRFRGDPNWRGWVTYSVVTAVLINVFIALFGISQHGGPLHPFAGALERFATNAEALWGLALVYRLWVRTPFYSSRPTG